jgi:GDP/UDP-N,N'-diacetylbacillosamine 2-epimerase (hydrolysing)
MATPAIRIGVLTSSRADFGIYLPLLKRMQQDSAFEVKLIVFGSHVSPFHGLTVRNIEAEGFAVDYRIDSLLAGDSEEAIATSMSLTMLKFSQFWGERASQFDLVLCLGDRYEMFAACSAGVPFQIRFAHIHGGEQTLGAMDNFFRHSLSHLAWCHFVSTAAFADRLKHMLDITDRIYTVGALSLDSLETLEFFSIEDIKERWNIDLRKPTILTTFHPETVRTSSNELFAYELVKAIESLSRFHVVITLPNADTLGTTVRRIFEERLGGLPHVTLIDNFGTRGYFSVMHHSAFLLGNTSSGIIEAASFGKYVINLGNRQEGRLQSDNVVNVPIEKDRILEAVESIAGKGDFRGENKYHRSGAAALITGAIKELFN